MPIHGCLPPGTATRDEASKVNLSTCILLSAESRMQGAVVFAGVEQDIPLSKMGLSQMGLKCFPLRRGAINYGPVRTRRKLTQVLERLERIA